MKPAYIISSSAVSPQHTFLADHFLQSIHTVPDGKLYNQRADHSQYINPVAIRRMSQLLKDGITAGMQCLAAAGLKTPDAIITGTSRGSVTDMEQFMKDMALRGEEALNPTCFIQSTYNSVNGWLAVNSGCKGYNQTYVHRGFSFELALQDTLMTLAEATDPITVLTGCFDELTPEYFLIRQKVGFFKNEFPQSDQLLQHYHTPGTIGGEGATFFTFTNTPQEKAIALTDLQMLYKPTADTVTNELLQFLARNQLQAADIDVMVSGMNGDARNWQVMSAINSIFSELTTIVVFKHLCGEYATAAGFGLWIAAHIMRSGHIPNDIVYQQGTQIKINNTLLCNINISDNVSFILLQTDM
jgi:3-oxoacyl-(acyl-carrier-protein) synthase